MAVATVRAFRSETRATLRDRRARELDAVTEHVTAHLDRSEV